MNTQQQLLSTITKFDLNQTKFYQAWSAGTLSDEALKCYANEYGNFIGQLAKGWITVGDQAQAQIEETHYDIWKDDFCRALEVKITEVAIPAIADLITTAESMFSHKTEALGALYIFIAQQASTSKSKIEGLQKHYSLPSFSESYFEEHLGSDVLADKLLKMIETLTPEEQKEVIAAANIFGEKIFFALEGIYDTYSRADCVL
jgi:pyrroloquinoline-quinone synthase